MNMRQLVMAVLFCSAGLVVARYKNSFQSRREAFAAQSLTDVATFVKSSESRQAMLAKQAQEVAARSQEKERSEDKGPYGK